MQDEFKPYPPRVLLAFWTAALVFCIAFWAGVFYFAAVWL